MMAATLFTYKKFTAQKWICQLLEECNIAYRAYVRVYNLYYCRHRLRSLKTFAFISKAKVYFVMKGKIVNYIQWKWNTGFFLFRFFNYMLLFCFSAFAFFADTMKYKWNNVLRQGTLQIMKGLSFEK